MYNKEALLTIALDAAKAAGQEVMRHYQRGDFTTTVKQDDSPVTSADLAANEVLIKHLSQHAPEIPIISEESGFLPLAKRQQWPCYWLLDPIDGTSEFIAGSGDFAVNVALVENNWPTMGVIHAPAHGLTYYAQQGIGAFKQSVEETTPIKVSEYQPGQAVRVAVSRRQKLSLMSQYLSDHFDYEHIPFGSCSLKNCLIAEGKADCYLRIGPTGEWDTGASQCIIEQAGGDIFDSEFNALSYNQRESLLNPDFITVGNKQFPWQEIIHSHRGHYQ